MGIEILDASKHMWLKNVFILTLILLCIKLKRREPLKGGNCAWFSFGQALPLELMMPFPLNKMNMDSVL